ncbi:hypothetical protein [Desulfopila inferna]|uniref:hypothetical protein n=1 Tax=Desulfopila inferna TaxID=468528 RepID=UPI0019661DE3|nr:hypothetical protein [Desulfopila inferna]MBM9606176.1 hypothetical protein [Desulfopila inferna]
MQNLKTCNAAKIGFVDVGVVYACMGAYATASNIENAKIALPAREKRRRALLRLIRIYFPDSLCKKKSCGRICGKRDSSVLPAMKQ